MRWGGVADGQGVACVVGGGAGRVAEHVEAAVLVEAAAAKSVWLVHALGPVLGSGPVGLAEPVQPAGLVDAAVIKAV